MFGDRVKLIKADYATTALLGTDGDYSKMYTANNWDNSVYKGNNLANIASYTWNYKNNTTINSGFGSNTWSTSLLNKTNLNKNFITNIGDDWANKIDTTTWKVGGNTWANIGTQPAKTAYQNEIVNPVTTNTTDNVTTYSAKVGLMYASDYGFAAAPSAWTANLNTYNGEAIKNVNWMYMGLYEWTISRYADNAYDVFYVYYTGYVNYYIANNAYGVRPVFYLTSSVNYASGSGSATDPILVN
ncbi:unknown [Clostridium sp. CAG:609]|nr:unknown [Clostridium sp. CAG:609]